MKLDQTLALHSPNIVFITETWLHSEILDSEIFPFSHYSVVARSDRSCGTHGGVLIALNNQTSLPCFASSVVNDYSCSISFISSSSYLTLILFYNPPFASQYRVSSSDIQKTVECYLSAFDGRACEDNHVVLLGDFNYPDIDWSTGCSKFTDSSTFLELTDSLYLSQLVNFPTHTSGNTLDLILTNRPEIVKISCPFMYSDHKCIPFSIAHMNRSSYQSTRCCATNLAYSKSLFSVVKFNAELQCGYDILHTGACIPFSTFTSVTTIALDSACPRKTHRRNEFPSYFSSHSIHMANKLRTARKHGKLDRISILERDLEHSIQLDKAIHLSSFSVANTKSCFNYLRNFSSTRDIPSDIHWGDVIATTELHSAANIFNDYFLSVYAPGAVASVQSLPAATIKLCDLSFSVSDVESLLFNIKTGICSVDKIPSFVYGTCASQLAPIVHSVLCDIIHHGAWPNDWKVAIITPVFKSGDRFSVTNYRPVSILHPLSLVLERFLFNHIYPKVRSMIHENQHGFTKKKSTVTQMLAYTDLLYANRGFAAVAYFDFQKAFDTVPHTLLLQKLTAFGLDQAYINLLSSYLSARCQIVKVHGHFSYLGYISSGVPQGSILGPLLFLMFINDLFDYIDCSSLYLFADDAKLANFDSNAELDELIQRFVQWSSNNKLAVHTTKCLIIPFHNSNVLSFTHSLPISYSVKDLGIMLSSDLTWDLHINTKFSSVKRIFGMLKRNVPFICDQSVKIMFIRHCVLSVLYYASEVFSVSVTWLRRLHSFQRRCLRWSVCAQNSFEHNLVTAGILPIAYQLIYNDLVFLNNALNSTIDFNIHQYISVRYPPAHLRSAPRAYFQPIRQHRHKNFFDRVSVYANRMQSCAGGIILPQPVNSFKRSLRYYLHSQVASKFDSQSPSTWNPF